METAQQQTLQDTLAEYAASDAATFRASFRRMRQSFPGEIAEACLRYLGARGLDAAGRQIALWVASETGCLDPLFDPGCLPLDIGLKATAALREIDPQFLMKFLRAASALTAAPQLLRALTLLPSLGDYSAAIPLLRTSSHHADRHVKSKAVKLLCQLRPDKALVERQMLSDDPRVRASAIEALWRVHTPDAQAILHAAQADPHHRVVGNALVGLYLQKDPTAFESMVRLAKHPEPAFRATMAWAFGHIADKRAVPVLEGLSKDSFLTVRKRALNSLLILHPDHPAVIAGLAEVEQAPGETKPSPSFMPRFVNL